MTDRTSDANIIIPKDNPAAEPIMQFFAYEHLPEHLQGVSKPFGDLARTRRCGRCSRSKEIWPRTDVGWVAP